MKILTKKDGRVELEKLAIKVIMKNKNEFEVGDIVVEIRALCDEEIELGEIIDVVFNAMDYLLHEGCIDIVARFTYMVDPVKQIQFEQTGKIDSSVSV